LTCSMRRRKTAFSSRTSWDFIPRRSKGLGFTCVMT
jgi:hypothetical protein